MDRADAFSPIHDADYLTARRAGAPADGTDFILLGLYTGLRRNGMLGLAWSRVNLRTNLIYLGSDDQKSGQVGSVPLNKTAREALLSRMRFRAEYCPTSPWVFCRKAGTKIASVKTGLNAAVERAGLEDVHTHDLRRTFGSWPVQAGVDIRRVSELMRHSHIEITAAVYAHLAPGDLMTAVEVLDSPEEGTPVSHYPKKARKARIIRRQTTEEQREKWSG